MELQVQNSFKAYLEAFIAIKAILNSVSNMKFKRIMSLMNRGVFEFLKASQTHGNLSLVYNTNA